jgi:uncharacterized membrane protein HdeD (DUF308 family)
MKGIGIVLIIIGIVMMVFRSINFTEKKKVADVGPIEINKQENHSVNWPLYAGIVVTVAGVVVLLASNKNKA